MLCARYTLFQQHAKFHDQYPLTVTVTTRNTSFSIYTYPLTGKVKQHKLTFLQSIPPNRYPLPLQLPQGTLLFQFTRIQWRLGSGQGTVISTSLRLRHETLLFQFTRIQWRLGSGQRTVISISFEISLSLFAYAYGMTTNTSFSIYTHRVTVRVRVRYSNFNIIRNFKFDIH